MKKLILGFLIISLPAAAQTPLEKAQMSRVAYSAFQCSTFAEMSGDENEQKRLFEVGLKAGRGFLKAAEGNEIPREHAMKEVPVGVSLVMQGPTLEFILGRIYASAADHAYDSIVKQKDGVPVDPGKYITDPRLKKMIAQNRYTSANCALLK